LRVTGEWRRRKGTWSLGWDPSKIFDACEGGAKVSKKCSDELAAFHWQYCRLALTVTRSSPPSLTFSAILVPFFCGSTFPDFSVLLSFWLGEGKVHRRRNGAEMSI